MSEAADMRGSSRRRLTASYDGCALLLLYVRVNVDSCTHSLSCLMWLCIHVHLAECDAHAWAKI